MPNGIYIGDGHDIISDDARLLASHDGCITYLNEELFIKDDENNYIYLILPVNFTTVS